MCDVGEYGSDDSADARGESRTGNGSYDDEYASLAGWIVAESSQPQRIGAKADQKRDDE